MTRKIEVRPGDIVIRGARPFHSGFEGWSDLGGWAPVVVTAEMIGSTLPVYAQVEVKAGTDLTAEQRKWIDAVKKVGGKAGVARNEDDLKKILFGNE